MNEPASPQVIPAEIDVAIIGAGIAGLCAAIAAAKRGARVAILEAHEPGGRAATTERDGFHLNVGAHALYRSGHLTKMLAARGITPAGGIVTGTSVDVLLGDEVRRVEMTAMGLMRNPAVRARHRLRIATLFAKLPKMNADKLVGQSLGEFLGSEAEEVRHFMEMFVRVSSYTHAPDEFDAGAAVTQLQLAQQGVRYLDGGWARLIALLRDLAVAEGATIITRAEVSDVRADGNHVEVGFGERSLTARSAVVAAGGAELTSRLTGREVKDKESLTEPIAANCLDLALTQRRQVFLLGLNQPVYLSAHAPTAALAPTGRGLVSLLRYLGPGESPGEPVAARTLLRNVARAAGITDDDVIFERPLHRMVVTHGAPTAAGGGLRGRPSINALGVPNLFLAGDWVGPTGMLADASSASGESAGTAAAELCARIRA
jgi:glycine/D-amino acid oxidase-like deaminating enzyme